MKRCSRSEEMTMGTRDQTALELVELLLKQPEGLDELNRQPFWQRQLFPRFLFIGEAAFFIYAVVIMVLFNLVPSSALALCPWLRWPSASWADGSGSGLILAYTLGVLLAASVCLPSFYFYSLLAGVTMSWLQITSLIGKGTAANGILLLGILPIYVAMVLGLVIFEAPPLSLHWALIVGLGLPFLTGLWGLRSIYVGILDIHQTQRRAGFCRRTAFLKRLILSWAAVYAVVIPVMIYRLWELFADIIQG